MEREELSRISHNVLNNLISRRVNELLPIRVNELQYGTFIRIMKEDLIAYYDHILHLDSEEVESIIIEDFLRRGNEALEEFDSWIKLWYNKWLERTKILTKKEMDTMTTILAGFNKNIKCLEVDNEVMKHLINVAVETLVEEKELCCTNVMAKDIVLYSLRQQYHTVKSVMNIEDQLRLMTSVIRRTRAIVKITGPLVYLRAE